MTKTAYLPLEELPIVQELRANFDKVHSDTMGLLDRYGHNNKFLKTIVGGRNESEKGRRSYYGVVKNVGLLLDPVVLDKVEYKLAFGTTKEEYDQKQALIKERRDSAPWIGPWIERNMDKLVHVSLFILSPGASITRHYGVTDQIVRCHLGVQPNPAALFHTEWDPPRTWEENGVFAFLDYYAPHWVTFENATEEQPRVVFNFDVKPDYYEKFYPGVLAKAIASVKS